MRPHPRDRAELSMGVMELLGTQLYAWPTPPMTPTSTASISNRSRHYGIAVSNDNSTATVRGGRQK